MKFIFFLFVTSLIFKSTKCVRTFSNSIQKITLEEGSKNCYTCYEDCSSQTAETCASSSSSCFFKMVENYNGKKQQFKGCIEADTVDSFCDYEVEDILTCYTCDDDLCNKDDGPSRCYLCIGECTVPADEEYCSKVLQDSYGKPMKAACRWYENRTEDRVEVIKGCVPDDSETRAKCEEDNQKPEVNCTMCDTTVCNGEQETGEYVEECYFCGGTCLEKMMVQNCTEMFGKDVRTKCLTIDTPLNGGHDVLRRCIISTTLVQQNCNSPVQPNEKCTLCDTNLCNGKKEGYVDECYWCDGTCRSIVDTQSCEYALGADAISRCIAITRQQDGKTIETRKCVDVNKTVQADCDRINREGGNCTICNSHLCNDGPVADDGNDDDDDDDDDDNNSDENNDDNEDGGPSKSERIHSVIYILLLTYCLLFL